MFFSTTGLNTTAAGRGLHLFFPRGDCAEMWAALNKTITPDPTIGRSQFFLMGSPLVRPGGRVRFSTLARYSRISGRGGDPPRVDIAYPETRSAGWFALRRFAILSMKTTIKSIATMVSRQVARKTMTLTGALKMNRYGLSNNKSA
jgi:hypothetical protein